MDAERQARIRECAYHIWEREGRPHGKEHDHWHRAAQEVDSEPGPQRRRTESPTKASSREIAEPASKANKATA
jgi:hypothetical protein